VRFLAGFEAFQFYAAVARPPSSGRTLLVLKAIKTGIVVR
jgi:hypothetical protein